ncbi:MAG: NUDIX domain-containing protein [Planctomycetota bacterium]
MKRGVVAVVRGGPRFLMIRRADHILAGGAWCFVGGAIDPGETQAEALVREFREEVGGEVRPVACVWEYARPDGRLYLYWWLAELVDEVLHPNPAEVAELRWCTPDEIEALPGILSGNIEFLQAVGRHLLVDGTH